MHYHCEIILPPTDDVSAAVAQIMAPFDENNEEQNHAFWDFWVIGGRWAGTKLMAKYPQTELDAFHDWMKAEKVTVSGLVAGKQELSPPSQIAKVDAEWNRRFPSGTFMACPLFRHSNDQYGKTLDGALQDDVMALKDLLPELSACRVIIARKNHTDDALEAEFMLCDEQWNGCNYMKVQWDGKVATAVQEYRAKLEDYMPEYREKSLPRDDWLVVTVDYHS